MDKISKPDNGDNSDDVYPDIAQSIVRSIKIPSLPISEREKHIRPDTFRIYVPESEKYDSDEDERRNELDEDLIEYYKSKRIERVVSRRKTNTGRVNYTIMFKGRDRIEETVSWKIIHDHPDWNMIEEYEYQSALAKDKKSRQQQ